MKLVALTPLLNEHKYFSIGWGLTDLCNYRCSYCFPGNYQAKYKSLGLEKSLHYARSLQNLLHDKKIIWTLAGGEPTLLPELPQLLQCFQDHQDLVLMTSNGTAPLEWWEKNLSAFYTVELSYHHGKSNLEHFLDVAMLIEKSQAIGHIHLMVNQENFDEVYEIALQIKEKSGLSLGFSTIYQQQAGHILPTQYKSEQKKLMSEFKDNYRQEHKPQLLDLGKLLITQRSSSGDEINSSIEANTLEWQGLNRFKGWECAAGLEGIYIDIEGQIRPSRCDLKNMSWSLTDFTCFFKNATPLICPHGYCACGPDLLFSKKEISPCF